jgi:hypothetical protein
MSSSASASGGIVPVAGYSRALTNLDLTSTQATLTSGRLAQTGPVSILVGGASRTFGSGALLTPAEKLAVYQVLSTGHQSIEIGASGNATGGTLNIGSRFSQFVSSLNIPQGVTAITNAAIAQSLKLSGNLTNSGALYVYSSDPNVTAASISATNIHNMTGAIISSALPSSIASLSKTPNLDLNLSAVQAVINAGTIQSSGSLNVAAGRLIANSSAVGSAANRGTTAQAMILANGNLTMQSPAIINSGTIASLKNDVTFATSCLSNSSLIQAMSGNIQIQNYLASGTTVGSNARSQTLNQALASYFGPTLSINNSGGTLAAANEISISAISPSLASSTAPASSPSDGDQTQVSNGSDSTLLAMQGGVLSANQIKFTSQTGAINANIDSAQGNVSLAAGSTVSFSVANNDLSVDSVIAPSGATIANSGGSIFLNDGFSFQSPGANLALLASENIVAANQSGSNTAIDLSHPSQGGSLTLAAGFNISASDSGISSQPLTEDSSSSDSAPAVTGQSAQTPLSSSPASQTTYTLTGPSAAGGSIQLHNINIKTSSPSGNGGNVTMVAHGGAQNQGTVDICCSAGTNFIHTYSGDGLAESSGTASDNTGTAGNVLIMGHAIGVNDSSSQPGQIIVAARINANSSKGQAGGIAIYGSEPVINGQAVSIVNGTSTGGMFSPATDNDGRLLVTQGGGNVYFTGALGAVGADSSSAISLAGRNVEIHPTGNISSSGDFSVYGEDSVFLGAGMYLAGTLKAKAAVPTPGTMTPDHIVAGQNQSQDAPTIFNGQIFQSLVSGDTLKTAGSIEVKGGAITIGGEGALFNSNFGDINFVSTGDITQSTNCQQCNGAQFISIAGNIRLAALGNIALLGPQYAPGTLQPLAIKVDGPGPILSGSTFIAWGTMLDSTDNVSAQPSAPSNRMIPLAYVQHSSSTAIVDSSLSFRGGGIEISAGSITDNSLPDLLASTPLDLPGIANPSPATTTVGTSVPSVSKLAPLINSGRSAPSSITMTKVSDSTGMSAADSSTVIPANSVPVSSTLLPYLGRNVNTSSFGKGVSFGPQPYLFDWGVLQNNGDQPAQSTGPSPAKPLNGVTPSAATASTAAVRLDYGNINLYQGAIVFNTHNGKTISAPGATLTAAAPDPNATSNKGVTFTFTPVSGGDVANQPAPTAPNGPVRPPVAAPTSNGWYEIKDDLDPDAQQALSNYDPSNGPPPQGVYPGGGGKRDKSDGTDSALKTGSLQPLLEAVNCGGCLWEVKDTDGSIWALYVCRGCAPISKDRFSVLKQYPTGEGWTLQKLASASGSVTATYRYVGSKSAPKPVNPVQPESDGTVPKPPKSIERINQKLAKLDLAMDLSDGWYDPQLVDSYLSKVDALTAKRDFLQALVNGDGAAILDASSKLAEANQNAAYQNVIDGSPNLPNDQLATLQLIKQSLQQKLWELAETSKAPDQTAIDNYAAMVQNRLDYVSAKIDLLSGGNYYAAAGQLNVSREIGFGMNDSWIASNMKLDNLSLDMYSAAIKPYADQQLSQLANQTLNLQNQFDSSKADISNLQKKLSDARLDQSILRTQLSITDSNDSNAGRLQLELNKLNNEINLLEGTLAGQIKAQPLLSNSLVTTISLNDQLSSLNTSDPNSAATILQTANLQQQLADYSAAIGKATNALTSDYLAKSQTNERNYEINLSNYNLADALNINREMTALVDQVYSPISALYQESTRIVNAVPENYDVLGTSDPFGLSRLQLNKGETLESFVDRIARGTLTTDEGKYLLANLPTVLGENSFALNSFEQNRRLSDELAYEAAQQNYLNDRYGNPLTGLRNLSSDLIGLSNSTVDLGDLRQNLMNGTYTPSLSISGFGNFVLDLAGFGVDNTVGLANKYAFPAMDQVAQSVFGSGTFNVNIAGFDVFHFTTNLRSDNLTGTLDNIRAANEFNIQATNNAINDSQSMLTELGNFMISAPTAEARLQALGSFLGAYDNLSQLGTQARYNLEIGNDIAKANLGSYNQLGQIAITESAKIYAGFMGMGIAGQAIQGTATMGEVLSTLGQMGLLNSVVGSAIAGLKGGDAETIVQSGILGGLEGVKETAKGGLFTIGSNFLTQPVNSILGLEGAAATSFGQRVGSYIAGFPVSSGVMAGMNAFETAVAGGSAEQIQSAASKGLLDGAIFHGLFGLAGLQNPDVPSTSLTEGRLEKFLNADFARSLESRQSIAEGRLDRFVNADLAKGAQQSTSDVKSEISPSPAPLEIVQSLARWLTGKSEPASTGSKTDLSKLGETELQQRIADLAEQVQNLKSQQDSLPFSRSLEEAEISLNLKDGRLDSAAAEQYRQALDQKLQSDTQQLDLQITKAQAELWRTQQMAEASKFGDAIANTVQDALNRVPDNLLALLGRKNISLDIASGTLLEHLPDFQGRQPRGYESGTSLDNAPGVYSENLSLAVVPREFIAQNGVRTLNSQMADIILHEIGHGVDSAFMDAKNNSGPKGVQNISETQKFTEAVERDIARMPQEMRNSRGLEYFLGDKNPEGMYSEIFAQGTADIMKGAGDILSAFPEATKVIREMVFASAKEASAPNGSSDVLTANDISKSQLSPASPPDSLSAGRGPMENLEGWLNGFPKELVNVRDLLRQRATLEKEVEAQQQLVDQTQANLQFAKDFHKNQSPLTQAEWNRFNQDAAAAKQSLEQARSNLEQLDGDISQSIGRSVKNGVQESWLPDPLVKGPWDRPLGTSANPPADNPWGRPMSKSLPIEIMDNDGRSVQIEIPAGSEPRMVDTGKGTEFRSIGPNGEELLYRVMEPRIDDRGVSTYTNGYVRISRIDPVTGQEIYLDVYGRPVSQSDPLYQFLTHFNIVGIPAK